MSSYPKAFTNDLFQQMKTTSQQEMDLFKVDFTIVLHKVHMMFNTLLETLPNLVIAVMVFTLIMFSGVFFRKLIKRKCKIHPSVGLVIERITNIVILVLGFFIALAIIFPSVKPIDLMGGLGIVSLAIGFAIKDILNNFLSGILILLQEPFRVGDEVKYKEFEGIVDYINIRYTVIVGFDGQKHLIPNGEIYSTPIIANTLSHYRWSSCDINIDFSNDIENAKKIILHSLLKIEDVLQDPPPSVIVSHISSHAITLHIKWAAEPFHDHLVMVKGRVLEQIKKLLSMRPFTIPSEFLSKGNISRPLAPLSLQRIDQTIKNEEKSIQ